MTHPGPTLWRYRWLIAALCVAAASWVVVGELRPRDPPAVDVVVAAQEIPSGSVLEPSDLQVTQLRTAPDGAVDLATAIGSTVTIGLPEGVPVVGTMLLGPGLVDGAPPGWVVAPVPLADPLLAQLVRVGDRIDLYLAAADTGGRLEDAELVSAGALVLARPLPEDTAAPLLPGPTATNSDVLVVAIRPEDAGGVAGASGFGPFRAVLSAADQAF